MKRGGVVVAVVLLVALVVIGAIVLVLSPYGIGPPDDFSAEISYRIESADGEVVRSGRKRIGSEPAPEPEATVADPEPDGPVTKAQRLQWIREWMEIAIGKGYSFQDKFKAQRALLEFDAEEAIPILLEAATDPLSPGRQWALSVIGDFGNRAGPWVPDLVKILSEEPDLRLASALALGRIGGAATQALIDVVEGDDPAARRFAFSGLGMHRTFTRAQAESLVAFLKSEDEQTRLGAARAFAAANTVPEVIVPALIEVLADASGDLQTQAVVVLWNYGERAAAAVPALAAVIADEESDARATAVMVLGVMGDAAAVETPRLVALMEGAPSQWDPAVPDTLARFGVDALVTAMASENVRVRQSAITRMADVASEDEEAAPRGLRALEAALGDEDVNVRVAAVKELGYWGRGALEVLPAVIRATKDDSSSVRRAALTAAAQVGGPREDVLAVLLPALADGRAAVRASAAQALGALGTEADVAVDELESAVDDEDAYVRRRAAEALEGIGENAASAASTLARRLSDNDIHVRLACAVALLSVDRPGTAARDAIDKLRVDDNAAIRRQLVEGIGRHPDALWLPIVANRLDDRDDKVRAAAARAIGKFGILAMHHVAVLLERLEADPIGDVRVAIIAALGDLGPLAADAIPTLERLATDRTWQRYAQAALERIR